MGIIGNNIQPSEIKVDDIFIGHNLLATPAYLLDKVLDLDAGRFFDFCAFINSIVLHERLITLKARLPHALKNSKLYTYLEKRNILCALEYSYSDFVEDDIVDIKGLFDRSVSKSDVDYVIGDSLYSDVKFLQNSASVNALVYEEHFTDSGIKTGDSNIDSHYNELHINEPYLKLPRDNFIKSILNTPTKSELQKKVNEMNIQNKEIRDHRITTAI